MSGQAPARGNASRRGLLAAAGTIAVITLVARVVGFGRWFAFSHSVGATCVGSVYQSVNAVPNVLFEIAAGGVLAAVAVPLVAGALARGDRARRRRRRPRRCSRGRSSCSSRSVCSWPLAARADRVGACSAPGLPGEVDLGADLLRVFAVQIPLYGVAHRARRRAPVAPPLRRRRPRPPPVEPRRHRDLPRLPLRSSADPAAPIAEVPRSAPSSCSASARRSASWRSPLPLLVPVRRAGIRLRPRLALPRRRRPPGAPSRRGGPARRRWSAAGDPRRHPARQRPGWRRARSTSTPTPRPSPCCRMPSLPSRSPPRRSRRWPAPTPPRDGDRRRRTDRAPGVVDAAPGVARHARGVACSAQPPSSPSPYRSAPSSRPSTPARTTDASRETLAAMGDAVSALRPVGRRPRRHRTAHPSLVRPRPRPRWPESWPPSAGSRPWSCRCSSSTPTVPAGRRPCVALAVGSSLGLALGAVAPRRSRRAQLGLARRCGLPWRPLLAAASGSLAAAAAGRAVSSWLSMRGVGHSLGSSLAVGVGVGRARARPDERRRPRGRPRARRPGAPGPHADARAGGGDLVRVLMVLGQVSRRGRRARRRPRRRAPRPRATTSRS